MAVTITRSLTTPVDAQTINAGATYPSAQQTLTANGLYEQITMYVEVTGYAAAPAGNKRLIVKIAPVHTDGGDAFTDCCPSYAFTVTADQTYRFPGLVVALPQMFKILVVNDTDQNTDANAVTVKLERSTVTA
ncbi:MAG: hypothetical protein ABFE07_04770 [Armatimonadia bacterium]